MNPEFVFYNGVLARPDRISMVEGRTEVIIVRREDIQRITLEIGNQAERPIAQAAFGVVVILISLYPLFSLFTALLGYIRMNAIEFMILGFFPLGIWLIYSSLKYGAYLNVELEKDHRKLAFKKECSTDQLLEFCSQIGDLGYRVDTSNF